MLPLLIFRSALRIFRSALRIFRSALRIFRSALRIFRSALWPKGEQMPPSAAYRGFIPLGFAAGV
jgi:hypothetical protein